MKWNETMWNCPENIRNTTQFKAAAKCNAYQVQKECMQACAKADGWQNAQTNPVWTPNELLVKRSNKLHTVHSHQYHWIVYNNTTQIDTTATTIIYGLKLWQGTTAQHTAGFPSIKFYSHRLHLLQCNIHWKAECRKNTSNKYQRSLTDPCDGMVLQTKLHDHCDKLQRSSVGAPRYCQLTMAVQFDHSLRVYLCRAKSIYFHDRRAEAKF